MANAAFLRRELVETCRRLDELAFVPGSAGNISARLNRNTIFITPTGRPLRTLKSSDLVRVNLKGTSARRGTPSSELNVHALVFRSRPDVGAVIHAHPPACVGFAMARKDFGRPCNMEIYATMGRPLLVPFAPCGEWGELLAPLLNRADSFLLANHGVLTLGATLAEAQHRIEVMENFARALLVARLLGGEVPLSPRDLAAIERFMERVGLVKPCSLTFGRRRKKAR